MDWRFSTFLLFLFALLIGIPWATSESGLCGLAIAQKATSGCDATICLEFWLNRYQALIAAAIAGVIAYWAGRIVLRQTRATELQVAAQRNDFLKDRVRELRLIRTSASAIYRNCARDVHPARRISLSGNVGEMLAPSDDIPLASFASFIEALRRDLDAFERQIESSVMDEGSRKGAQDFGITVHFFLNECDNLVRYSRVNTNQADPYSTRRVTIPGPRNFSAFENVMRSYGEMNKTLDVELADFQRRLNGVTAIISGK